MAVGRSGRRNRGRHRWPLLPPNNSQVAGAKGGGGVFGHYNYTGEVHLVAGEDYTTTGLSGGAYEGGYVGGGEASSGSGSGSDGLGSMDDLTPLGDMHSSEFGATPTAPKDTMAVAVAGVGVGKGVGAAGGGAGKAAWEANLDYDTMSGSEDEGV